jgi:hypothetical protein
MPSRSCFRPGHRGGRPDVDVIALAVPAENRLVLGLGRSGGPTGPRYRAPDSSAPDVSAPGRIEARRRRRSPNRIKRLRHSARIARTKAPRGRWHSALRAAGADRASHGQRNTRTAWCPRRDPPLLGCSYPSVSGYEQHDVGTSVDASTQSEQMRSATTRPNSPRPVLDL